MARGLYQGSYHVVDVDQDRVRVLRVRKEEPGRMTPLAEIPLEAGPRRRVAFGWDDANIPLLARRTFLAELRADREIVRKGVKAEFVLDNEQAKIMIPDVRVEPGRRESREGRFVGRLETRGLAMGSHRLRIRMTAPDGEVYQRDESFGVEQLNGQPKQDWAFEAGDAVQSSPAFVDGTLYISSLDGKLTALDAATGKRRWTASAHGPILSTPVVVAGTVYAGSVDHHLYAIDASTGHIRWSFDAGGPLFASAAVSAGIVCIGGNGKIYGIDERTGQFRWTTEAGSFFQSRAAAADGVFYLGGWDNTLYALEAATGHPRWTVKMGRTERGRGALSFYYAPAIASPAVGMGHVYVCTNDGVLHAMNAANGQEDWAARAPSGGDAFGYSSPLLQDGRIYLGGLGSKGDCYALDSRSGAILWRCSTGYENYDSSPGTAGSLIAIGSVSGVMSWIDPGTGALKFQYALEPGHCFSTPAADGKRTFITSMNNRVYAIALP